MGNSGTSCGTCNEHRTAGNLRHAAGVFSCEPQKAPFSGVRVKVHPIQTLSPLLFALASVCLAQGNLSSKDASAAVLQAFQTHDIVMLGEIHWNKQEYEWLDSLVANPEFADRVDDIVMEFGNSLYQKSVDRYIAGEAVPIEEVQRAWRSILGLGPPPPIYGDLYKAVREATYTSPS